MKKRSFLSVLSLGFAWQYGSPVINLLRNLLTAFLSKLLVFSVKTGLVAPVTVRVYFTRPRAGTDQTNGRSWSNQKPLHRGSRTCRPFAPNQSAFKEDRGFIDWLDGIAIIT
jgi:hypothetical protein